MDEELEFLSSLGFIGRDVVAAVIKYRETSVSSVAFCETSSEEEVACECKNIVERSVATALDRLSELAALYRGNRKQDGIKGRIDATGKHLDLVRDICRTRSGTSTGDLLAAVDRHEEVYSRSVPNIIILLLSVVLLIGQWSDCPPRPELPSS